jgi:hypothetical protein
MERIEGLMRIYIYIALVLSSLYAKADDRFLFHTNECPTIYYKDFNVVTINEEQSGPRLKIAWKKIGEAEPYAASVTNAFTIALIQIVEILKDQGLEHLLPEEIEIYSLGKALPGKLSAFSAILCKSMQTDTSLRLLVNDGLLYRAINFKKNLAHELFHYLSQKLNKNFPQWLEEGMAMHFENVVSGREDLEWAAFHMQNSPWIPLLPRKELQTKDQKKSFYGHAHLFVRYLATRLEGDLLSRVLNHTSSEPAQIFPNFRSLFKDFSIAKYINRIDYYGHSLENRERFILIDDVKTNTKPAPAVPGSLFATTANLAGESYWISVDDMIKIESRSIAKSYRISIGY